MSALVLGLLLFLSTHSARFFAAANRAQYIDHYGMAKWKLAYSIVSLIGFCTHRLGLRPGAARAAAAVERAAVDPPSRGPAHAAGLRPVAAAYVPGTVIKARLGHPMMAESNCGRSPT